MIYDKKVLRIMVVMSFVLITIILIFAKSNLNLPNNVFWFLEIVFFIVGAMFFKYAETLAYKDELILQQDFDYLNEHQAQDYLSNWFQRNPNNSITLDFSKSTISSLHPDRKSNGRVYLCNPVLDDYKIMLIALRVDRSKDFGSLSTKIVNAMMSLREQEEWLLECEKRVLGKKTEKDTISEQLTVDPFGAQKKTTTIKRLEEEEKDTLVPKEKKEETGAV